VVDEGVDRLETRQGGLDDSGGGRRLADMAVHQGDAVGRRDLGGLRDLARSGDDVKAPLDKPCDEPRADSLRSSGDDGRPAWTAHGSSPQKLLSSTALDAQVDSTRGPSASVIEKRLSDFLGL